jgi:hypothetical protein
MIGIDGLEGAQRPQFRGIEEEGDLVGEASLIVLERQQIVSAARQDRLGDLRLCAPMASMVTSAPVSCRRASRSGMAVISLDLASVACWPSTRRWRAAQAETT